ncbi:hypothetical protein ACAF76_007740 [Brevibacillus sp. TJ4]|uniref:hypothetical protein n=1 Tax=Brevibacillus sp. TJ4 TaxID=3234853 RepID=UPI0037D4F3A8
MKGSKQSASSLRHKRSTARKRWRGQLSPQIVRVQVRPPRIHVRTPAPRLRFAQSPPSVQVEAPTVHVQAPEPLVLPAPVVHVDVEADDHPDEASVQGLRKELLKCLKQKQTVELLLPAMGEDSRRYRVGSLVRVDEGIVELEIPRTPESASTRVIYPLNRIAGLVPHLPSPLLS